MSESRRDHLLGLSAAMAADATSLGTTTGAALRIGNGEKLKGSPADICLSNCPSAATTVDAAGVGAAASGTATISCSGAGAPLSVFGAGASSTSFSSKLTGALALFVIL